MALHVAYTYFPDPCGGTEVYVRDLAQRLAAFGYLSAVAAPAPAGAEYTDVGLPVHRFAIDPAPRLEHAYGAPDEVAAIGFADILQRLRPAIVHLHARTAAVSELLMDLSHAAGARVVFTYHTPTVSCARGTMRLFGERPCDGLVERRRCTACALEGLGTPQPLARLASSGVGASAARWAGGAVRTLRAPSLIADRCDRFHSFIGKADRVVAVCDWVRALLERNGVPANRIMLSRQGAAMSAGRAISGPRSAGEALKIAYFGRADRSKGPDLLALALERIPGVQVNVDVFAVRQGSERAFDQLQAQAERDPRLRIVPPIAPERVVEAMAGYDLVAIPSRCLETGPLVALEAFAAGVPVLGVDLGGVAELVRDGIDGVLVPPDDPDAWGVAIARLAGSPGLVAKLRSKVAPPRTMDAAATDMAELYASLLGSRRQTAGAA